MTVTDTDTDTDTDTADTAELLAELVRDGAELWEEGGQVRFRAPRGVLTDDRRARLRAHRDDVLTLLRERGSPSTVVPDPEARYEPFGLTDVQAAYLLGRADPVGYGGVACHGYLELHFDTLDPAAVQAAWHRLVLRHDMLRAVVHPEGHQQVLAHVEEQPVAALDLRDRPGEVDAALAAARADLGHRMYPTTVWPLFELRVTRTAAHDVLHVSLDSLVADWASAGLLFEELETLLADPHAELEPLALTFRDYLHAERAVRSGPRHDRDREYWTARLDDLPPAPDLPCALPTAPPPPLVTRHSTGLDPAAWTALRETARAHDLTPSAVVLAAYAAVLARHARRPSFTLALTVLARLPLHPQVDRVVGDFTSVSLLAVDPAAGAAFGAAARALAGRLATDLEHRLCSGVEVLRELGRRRGRTAALMPVVYTSALGTGSPSRRPHGEGITQTPQVVLDCQVAETVVGAGRALQVHWDVRDGILAPGLVEEMIAGLGDLLGRLARGEAWDEAFAPARPASPAGRDPVELAEVEAALRSRPAIARAVAETGPGGELVVGVVPARADPDTRAARVAETEAVAGALHRAGAAPTPDRRVDDAAATSILGHLHARGLTLATGHTPDEVVAGLGPDPRHRWLVRRWLAVLVATGHLTADGDRLRSAAEVDPDDVRTAWDALGDGPYVAYHRAHAERLTALLAGEQDPFGLLFGVDATDLGAAHAIYRDEPVIAHANHVVAAAVHRVAVRRDPGLRILEVGAGTGATTAPVLAVLEGLDAHYVVSDVAGFLLAGARERHAGDPAVTVEALDLDAAPTRPARADVVVGAGVFDSALDPDAALAHAVTLLAPGGWLVLTEPVREPLHILLTQGFMMRPVDGDTDHGRAPLRDVDGWRAALRRAGADPVLVVGDDPDASIAVLLARPRPEQGDLDGGRLRADLAACWPPHLVPIRVDVLPDGLVDRERLRLAAAPACAPRSATEPADDLERRIAAVWASALGRDAVGRDDDLRALGADSLVTARVAGRVREEIGEAAGIPFDTVLRGMLNEPGVAALARQVRAATTPDPVATTTSATVPVADRAPSGLRERVDGSTALIVPFGGPDDGPVRVLFHAALGTMDYFGDLARALVAQELGPVVGIAVADVERYCASAPADLVGALADDYTDRLLAGGRTRFQLVGYCLGGLLAVEVARRLLERGIAPEDLTLVDSIPMLVATEDELALEAVFVPNLDLDPVRAVFGDDVDAADVVRAFEAVHAEYGRVPDGAMGRVGGDPGLDAVAAAYVTAAARPQPERLAGYAAAAAARRDVPVTPEMVPGLFRVFHQSVLAAHLELEPFVGDVTFLRAESEQSFGITAGVGAEAVPFWERTCLGGFRVLDVPGTHLGCVTPPYVDRVADYLAEPLR